MKRYKQYRLKPFLIGGVTLGCIGGFWGFASSTTLQGALTGFFVGGWVFMEFSILIAAADFDKTENNEKDS